MDDHNAGISTLCFLPRIVELDLVKSAFTDPASHIYWYEIDAELGNDPLSRLSEAASTEHASIEDLFNSDEHRGCGFHVTVGRDIPPDPWIDVAREFGRLRASSDVDGNPPVLAVLSEGMPAATTGRREAGVRSHHWWGVVGRLDVVVHLSDLFGGDVDEVHLAELVELAGFDLGLGTQLHAADVSDPASARSVLATWADRHLMEPHGPVKATQVSGGNPGRFADLWIRGEVDSLDGRVHLSIAAADTNGGGEDPVRRAIWVGQVRSLMPQLELWKTNALRVLKESGVVVKDDDGLEIRDVARVARRSRRSLPRGLPPAVAWLLEARNKLAHLELVPSEDRQNGAKLLRRAGLL